MKPLSKIDCCWTPALAYVIGLLATDGNLSIDGRHINFTSKDYELAVLFRTYLGLTVTIGKKSRGGGGEKKYFVVQCGDVIFYRFLLSIGLTPRKSKTISALKVPHNYFFDFLRGCIDGDGSIGVFTHPESKHPQLRVRLVSASKPFLEWIKSVTSSYGINGFFTIGKRVHVLVYAIADSTKLLPLIYYSGSPQSLTRKREKAELYAGVAKWQTRQA